MYAYRYVFKCVWYIGKNDVLMVNFLKSITLRRYVRRIVLLLGNKCGSTYGQNVMIFVTFRYF